MDTCRHAVPHPGSTQPITEGLVGAGEADVHGGICKVAHRAEGVPQVVLPAAGLLLADAGIAVEVGVRPVRQDMRQSSGQVHRVAGRSPVQGLPQPIPQAIVREGVGAWALDDRSQAIRLGVPWDLRQCFAWVA